MSNTDVKIKTKSEFFKYSVRGIIEQDGKYLLMRFLDVAEDLLSGFYFLGGCVEIGEDSYTAIKREIKEEIGCEIEAKFICFVENFYHHANKLCHDVGGLFLIKPLSQLPMEDFIVIENDKGEEKKLEFKWLTKEQLATFDVRPKMVLVTFNK